MIPREQLDRQLFPGVNAFTAAAPAAEAMTWEERSPAGAVTEADKRRVSAVVVNYNAGLLLTRCIKSMLAQGIGEVVVVDNASWDGSLGVLRSAVSRDRRVRIIRNDENLGFAAACNIGVDACTGRFLLFLNPDARLEEGALEHMLKALVSAPDVGMVGGLLCNPDGSEQAGGRRVLPTPRRAFVRAFGLASLARLSPRLFSDFLLHSEPLPDRAVAVEAISGACMMAKREAVDDVGLWDEDYFLHCEDVDWCMRFSQSGWKTLFVPDARVIHYKGTCSKTRPIFVEWHKHRGMVRFYRKFFRDQYPGPMMVLVTIAVWLRFVLVFASYVVRPRWWQLAVRPVLLRLKAG